MKEVRMESIITMRVRTENAQGSRERHPQAALRMTALSQGLRTPRTLLNLPSSTASCARRCVQILLPGSTHQQAPSDPNKARPKNHAQA